MPLKHAWRVHDCAWKEWLPVPLVIPQMLSYRTTAFKCHLPSPPHPRKSSLLNRYNPVCSWSSHCLYWIWDLLTWECSPTITGNRDRKMLFCGVVYKYHTCTYGKIPWNTSFAFNECTAFVAFSSWQQNSVLVFVVILVTKGIPYLLSWADGTPISQEIMPSQSSDKDLLFPHLPMSNGPDPNSPPRGVCERLQPTLIYLH